MQHLLLVHADDDAVVHLEPSVAQLDEGDVCQGKHGARLRGPAGTIVLVESEGGDFDCQDEGSSAGRYIRNGGVPFDHSKGLSLFPDLSIPENDFP